MHKNDDEKSAERVEKLKKYLSYSYAVFTPCLGHLYHYPVGYISK